MSGGRIRRIAISPSATSWSASSASFPDRLFLGHMPEGYLGTLYLDVDTYAFGS